MEGTPPGTPLRHAHRKQRRPARAHAVGPVLGPHAHTDRTRDTLVAEPPLPAPGDGPLGEGQRLTPDAPRNGGRPSPQGRPPTTPAVRSPHRACRLTGQCRAPTPAHPCPQHVGDGPRRPARRPAAEGRRLTPDAPHRAYQPRGQTVLGPIPAHSCPQHKDSGPRQPPGGGQPDD